MFDGFIKGIISIITVTSAPLVYRYPYRNSAEGLRADFNNISQDIYHAIGQLERWQKRPNDDD